MNAARRGFALLLASLALGLVVLEALALLASQQGRTDEDLRTMGGVIGLWTGFAICLAGSAVYLRRPRAEWDARLSCPSCGKRNALKYSYIGQPRISVAAWVLSGFIGSLLYSAARKRRFRCDACGQASERRTAGGWLAAAWLLLLAALIVCTVVHDM